MTVLKLIMKIVIAPVILLLTLAIWICVGLVYVSGLVLGLLSTVIALLGVAVLVTYSPQNGLILLVIAFLIILLISNPFKGLIISQMILSIQLPITIFSQVYLTSSEKVMGKYKNRTSTKFMLYGLGAVVSILNVALFISFFV